MINDLKEYAKTHSIYDLNSEDLMKIYEYPHIEVEIIEAFDINKKELEKIRKKLKIKNIHLETIERNIIATLYYVYKNFDEFEDSLMNTYISLMYKGFCSVLPRKDFYLKKLDSINWLDLDIVKEIKNRDIDIDYRLEHNNSFLISKLKPILEMDKNSRKINNYYDKPTYKNLKEKMNQGIILNKNDLTYDTIYQLAIVENIQDEDIAKLFNLEKKDIIDFRNKNDLENVFLKRAVDFPNLYRRQYIKNLIEVPNDEVLNKRLEIELLELINRKHWKIENYYKYLSQKNLKDLEISNDTKYNVTIENYIHKEENKVKKQNRKNTGKKINQGKANTKKLFSGKFGEEQVYIKEKEDLFKCGMYEESKNVIWKTRTDDEDITLDGLGYDIESYNEQGEKIFIEVKTSFNNSSDKPKFYISKKEMDIMLGKDKIIPKEKYFIYYVKVDKNNNIHIDRINHLEFAKIEFDIATYVTK